MNEHIVVRRGTEADLPQIAAINTAVFLGDRDRLDGALEWATCWHKAFPLYHYFIIEVDGEVAGYAGWQVHGGFHRAEPVIELDQIGIDKKYQGQQLAPHLMRECMRELVEWMQQKNDRIESHVTFTVWGYTFNFAHEALMRAGRYAFAHRRDKKTDFRQLWIVRLNAAVRENGHKSYSTFIAKLKKANFELDRKVLAQFASEKPEIFARIAKQVV